MDQMKPPGAIATFFSYGFRPFFLLASLQAVIAMGLFLFWMGIHYAGGQVVELSIAMAPYIWHGHEMLYGFTMAVIAGFFLTAVPNWTGTHAIEGRMLMVLVASWLAGRLAMGFSAHLHPLLTAALDLSLIPLLAPLVISAMMRNWSKRNFIFLPILGLLFIGNLFTHLSFMGVYEGGAIVGLRLGLDTTILLIAIIGGRVVPAFTTNALRNQGIEDLPVNRAPVNAAGIFLVAGLVIADLIAPEAKVTGWLALAAALANAIRLIGWRGHLTLGQPIVWILHLGFLWLVAGLALKGVSALDLGIAEPTAIHAFTAGAIGTMTLAIMSRAALGHTGRPLVVRPVVVLAYVLVSLGALGRVVTPVLAMDYYSEGILLSGVAWAAAFLIFAVVYWPILTGPRAGRGA